MGDQYGASYKKVTVEDVRRSMAYAWIASYLSLSFSFRCFEVGMLHPRGMYGDYYLWDEVRVLRGFRVWGSSILVGDDRFVILM